MKLTKEQQLVVEQNMGLVGKVIKDKVHGATMSYDDLFQIGCIGLCKAAATDRGGRFSTYAYRLIWHEICDALIRETRRSEREAVIKSEEWQPKKEFGGNDVSAAMELSAALRNAAAEACPMVRKGIRSLVLMERGYTCREIGERMGVSANVVTAWISKARKYLRERDDVQAIWSGRAA